MTWCHELSYSSCWALNWSCNWPFTLPEWILQTVKESISVSIDPFSVRDYRKHWQGASGFVLLSNSPQAGSERIAKGRKLSSLQKHLGVNWIHSYHRWDKIKRKISSNSNFQWLGGLDSLALSMSPEEIPIRFHAFSLQRTSHNVFS